MNRQGPGKIEYCDYTWNPIVGCLRNCPYCFARPIAERFKGTKGFPNGFAPTWHPERLGEPLKLRKPARIFVGDMGDIMGDWSWKLPSFPIRYVTDCWVIHQVIKVVRECPQHTFLFLTKNPAAYARYEWPENCWLGTTVTCQADADERIPLLLTAKAKVRWLSIEPMLGPVELMYPKTIWPDGPEVCCSGRYCGCMGLPIDPPLMFGFDGSINWVVLGGQSGPAAKPLHPDWVRRVRDDCKAAGVPFFLKSMCIDDKLVKMPILDGKQWREMPDAQ